MQALRQGRNLLLRHINQSKKHARRLRFFDA
jgi:hypothetical protein